MTRRESPLAVAAPVVATIVNGAPCPKTHAETPQLKPQPPLYPVDRLLPKSRLQQMKRLFERTAGSQRVERA
jgi:hypothetical protein